MRATRRQILKTGGGSVVGLSLAGWGGAHVGTALAADAKQVDFPYLWGGPEGDAMQAIVDAFNASQSDYAVKGYSNPDAQRQLAQMTSNKGFDVSDNFDSNIGTWASKGALEPLDTYISGNSYDTADFVPNVMDKMSYDGKVYSLPIAVHTLQLMVNEDLLTAAGVKIPTTHTELAAAIDKLTVVDGKTIKQLGMGTPDFIAFAYTFGGGWIDDSGKPTANDPGNIAAVQFWVDNVLSKYGADNVKRFESGFGEYASAQAPFYTGQVAMSMDGEWQARFIQQYAPDLKWSAGPLPIADDKPELAGTTSLAASTFFIPANAQEKDGAWAFIKYLFDAPQMRNFTVALANLPSRTSLLGDKAYADIPGMSYWLDSLKSDNLRSMPNVTWGQEYATEITAAIDSVINSGTAPADAMDELQSKAEKLAAG